MEHAAGSLFDPGSHSPHFVSIYNKLDYFIKTNKIPNIIFHGPSATENKNIVFHFLNKIYQEDKHTIKTNTMIVNCSHGKGIKFIRDEIKYFSKTNIQYKIGVSFKSIVLFHADCLTLDALSALRRCIEICSHNTRFFIVVENKHKLINPIISRFCEIYIPPLPPVPQPTSVLLRSSDDEQTIPLSSEEESRKTRMDWLQRYLEPVFQVTASYEGSVPSPAFDLCQHLIDISNHLYKTAFSVFDILETMKGCPTLKEKRKTEISLYFYKIKKNFRCEKLLMFVILYEICSPQGATGTTVDSAGEGESHKKWDGNMAMAEAVAEAVKEADNNI